MRHRPPRGISAHPLELLPLTGRHDQARMEIKAVRPRVTAADRRRLGLAWRLTQPTNPSALMMQATNVGFYEAAIQTCPVHARHVTRR